MSKIDQTDETQQQNARIAILNEERVVVSPESMDMPTIEAQYELQIRDQLPKSQLEKSPMDMSFPSRKGSDSR